MFRSGSIRIRPITGNSRIPIFAALIKGKGDLSEWLKEHAWKVCIRQRIEGSNPSLTAILKEELQQCGSFCICDSRGGRVRALVGSSRAQRDNVALATARRGIILSRRPI